MKQSTKRLCLLLALLLLCSPVTLLCRAADLGDLGKENGDMPLSDGQYTGTATPPGEDAPIEEMGEAVATAAENGTMGQIIAIVLAVLIVVAFVVFIFVIMPRHKL